MIENKYLDFERPIIELEKKIAELRAAAQEGGIESLDEEIRDVERKLDTALRELASRLTPWQRTQLARHPARPLATDLAERIFEDFLELHGDRSFRDDAAILAGPARFRGREVLLILQEKGRETAEKVRHNFGMAHPEGYRKVMRFLSQAERFGRPVISLIDTPGAYPGIGAEERGQAWAIAASIERFFAFPGVTLATVIGEGGSGGALALGVADKVLMMENAIYSVISPEGCASILFRDAARAPEAAAAMKVTAQDARRLGVIDGIVEEPPGGAHRNPDEAAKRLGDALAEALEEMEGMKKSDRLEARYRKFRKMGVFHEVDA
ncbi:MAG: acetyl-CoA carboxylase carboxyltransferase subunit alpha [Candidatus Hydrogenedentota bacterium]|nr:MAG: acetyl-CoA carboxylase carboxyltransferase subunit alpha [Candidatus Hydrogenedentota bacterium]